MKATTQVEIVLTDLAGNQATVSSAVSPSRTIEPTVEILEGGLPIPAGAIFTRIVTPEVRATPADATVDVTLNGAPFMLGALLDSHRRLHSRRHRHRQLRPHRHRPR